MLCIHDSRLRRDKAALLLVCTGNVTGGKSLGCAHTDRYSVVSKNKVCWTYESAVSRP